MYNTGVGTAISMYINPNLPPGPALAVTANRFLRIDLAPNETTFFESTYPIVMTNTLSVEVNAPEAVERVLVLPYRQRRRCLIMGIKGFNQSGDEFINKFVRVSVKDSTGIDAGRSTSYWTSSKWWCN